VRQPKFTKEELDAVIEALQFYTVGDMSDAGLDPNDPEHVRQWDNAYNAMQKAVAAKRESERK